MPDVEATRKWGWRLRKKTKSKKPNPSEWGSVPIFPEPPPPSLAGTSLAGSRGTSTFVLLVAIVFLPRLPGPERSQALAPSPGACTPHWQHHGCLLGALDQREASFSSDSRISTLEPGI